ncbi:phytoene desaturase family protein [Corynebacterium timonense]|uniref:Phytoene dehydrogenase-related protein n=1 Tax=Corynebacterium timonense TaxID=441500 RepID=A0A1H1T2M3_9CORY|nr:NAD(P)/FAD-dependent oxidoreductase [Corynebacterium timonense]SDS54515.1 Phytoene dehydrogenase-related protein [Corynebacterium timonense]
MPEAVVVGAGPNGLAAAVELAEAGWAVRVVERRATIGGHCRTASLFPGTRSDLGAAAFPFGVATLDGDWLHAPRPVAHPLEKSTALLDALGPDQNTWNRLHGPIARHIDDHLDNILGPTLWRWPPHPLAMARFGLRAAPPATTLGAALFRTEEARALLVGNAVHSLRPPDGVLTAAFGVLFGALAMSKGWPVSAGGAQGVVEKLARRAEAAGAVIETGVEVREMPRADAVVLTMAPWDAARLGATVRPWRQGPGVFKVDWLLSGPVPWRDPRVGEAGTVHVGGTVAEIAHAERQVARGRMPNRPFVMVCQQYAADPSRGPVLWTYAHVPRGFSGDATGHIARQIERFAPGFRDTVVRPHVTGYIPDIAAGEMNLRQLVLRHPRRVGPTVWLASGANAPGAGVHGAAGVWAAREIIRSRRPGRPSRGRAGEGPGRA